MQLNLTGAVGVVTFTAPDVVESTELVFKLRVSDGSRKDTDEVTITVNGTN